MMLTIPSSLDSLVPTDQHEGEDIEISFDSNVYSIMVSQHRRVQSVVQVPKEDAVFGKRIRRALTRSPGTHHRRADIMRPMSPLKMRSSLHRDVEEDSRLDSSDGRAKRIMIRREHSCPPLRTSSHSIDKPIALKRELSLQPLLMRQQNASSNSSRYSPPTPPTVFRKTRKPNLVTSTVSNNGKILKTIRRTRQKQPSRRKL